MPKKSGQNQKQSKNKAPAPPQNINPSVPIPDKVFNFEQKSAQPGNHFERGGSSEQFSHQPFSSSNANWLRIARCLQLNDTSISADQAQVENKKLITDLSKNENTLYQSVKFDLGIFIFAMFQLALTNYIIFKGNTKHMDFALIAYTVIVLSRRILTKAHMYFQTVLYRVTLTQFAVLRTVPLVGFLILNYIAARIFLTNGMVNFVFLLHPLLLHAIVFGIPSGVLSTTQQQSNINEAYYVQQQQHQPAKPQSSKQSNVQPASQKKKTVLNQMSSSDIYPQKRELSSALDLQLENFPHFEFSNLQRYASAKDELQYLIKTILFNSFQITYFTGFLPVKFIRPDSNLYFDSFLLMICTIVNIMVLLFVHCAYYLRRRAVEMQFNAKMSGKWIQVPKPSPTSAQQIQEWRPHTSYHQGTIVSLSSAHHLQSQQAYNNQPVMGFSASQPNIKPQSANAPAQSQEAPAAQQVQQQDQQERGSIEYYMSVGSISNRSQPDDFIARLLYNIFSEPGRTMSYLQMNLLVVLIAYSVYIMFMKTQIMLPSQVINLLVCVYYGKIYLIDQQSYSPWSKTAEDDLEKHIKAASKIERNLADAL